MLWCRTINKPQFKKKYHWALKFLSCFKLWNSWKYLTVLLRIRSASLFSCLQGYKSASGMIKKLKLWRDSDMIGCVCECVLVLLPLPVNPRPPTPLFSAWVMFSRIVCFILCLSASAWGSSYSNTSFTYFLQEGKTPKMPGGRKGCIMLCAPWILFSYTK